MARNEHVDELAVKADHKKSAADYYRFSVYYNVSSDMRKVTLVYFPNFKAHRVGRKRRRSLAYVQVLICHGAFHCIYTGFKL